ncbi:MAG: 50S ribosomal protein L15 [bacterium]|nr:50S ribosomal protein L15 [bacterium]
MLDRLEPKHGARHRRKRVGRGPGSGTGKTAGRGDKGQGHRSAGRETPLWFEGGQMPLVRRIPKRGFTNIHRKAIEIVNLRDLEGLGDGATVDIELLVRKGLASGKVPVKLLAEGDAPSKITIKVQRASASAREKVEAAGGSVEIIG